MHTVTRTLHSISAAVLLAVALTAATACGDDRAADRPNIVLIVADDLGFSDLGAYGGEIRTPNLDALAREGLQLTNYHTGPTCGPTRAMLMTGVDHHRAGIGTNAVALRRLPELRGRPGYEGFLNDRVVTFAKLLQDAGYHTFMTGKWDLGSEPDKQPTARGFDRYFGLPTAGASHFSDATGVSRARAEAVYVEDGEPVSALPEDFYSSASYSDRLIEFIDDRPDDGQPYFAYLAFTAPHWPLHVPDDWIERYAGAYDEGWDVIRKRRFDRQVELGVLPPDTVLPPRNRAVPAWDTLPPARREVEQKRIELYAAMVELMDHHIGRFIERVTADDDRETVVFFVSDNGAEGNAIDALPDNAYWIPATFDNRLANMGREGSYVWLGVGWADATVSPLRLYKSYVNEGGIRVPAIVHSTTGRFGHARRDAIVTAMDIAPTILELAGVTHPGNSYRDREIIEMSGKSALGYLTGASGTVHGEAPIGWELYGNRALIQGDWKAVLTWPPEGGGQWELYNLRSDPTEMNDMADAEPERLAQMIRHWDLYAEQSGIAIFERDLGYGRYP